MSDREEEVLGERASAANSSSFPEPLSSEQAPGPAPEESPFSVERALAEPASSGAGAAGENAAPGQLPAIVLICAAVAVFEGVLLALCLVLWATNIDFLAALIRDFGTFGLLLGFGGMVPGWMVLRRNKKNKASLPGTVWANASVLIASGLATLTLCVPIIAALRNLFSA